MFSIQTHARSAVHRIKDKIRKRYFSGEKVTTIASSKGWRTIDLRELWAYRELFLALASRDIKIRYKETVLGCLWAIIQPLMGMVVFSVIFGHWAKISSEGYPYAVFVYAGLLPWTFFANALSGSSNSILASSQLITKVYFPRLIVPLATIGSGLVDFFIASGVMFLLMFYYGVGWTPYLLALPLLIALVAFIALGIGTLLSALVVAYRDFRFAIPFLLQFWMYTTPVVFPIDLVPLHWRWMLYLNPMAGTIDGFRSAFLGKPFNWDVLGLSFVSGVVMFLIGVFYFEQVERRFADFF